MPKCDPVEFTPIKEEWASYRCADGTIVEVKVAVLQIFILQEIDEMTGQPLVYVKHNILVRAKATNG